MTAPPQAMRGWLSAQDHAADLESWIGIKDDKRAIVSAAAMRSALRIICSAPHNRKRKCPPFDTSLPIFKSARLVYG